MLKLVAITSAGTTCGLILGCVVVVAALYLGYGAVDTTAGC